MLRVAVIQEWRIFSPFCMKIKKIIEANMSFFCSIKSNVAVSVQILHDHFRGGRGQGHDDVDYAGEVGWGRIGQNLII